MVATHRGYTGWPLWESHPDVPDETDGRIGRTMSHTSYPQTPLRHTVLRYTPVEWKGIVNYARGRTARPYTMLLARDGSLLLIWWNRTTRSFVVDLGPSVTA
jgi:hypothetical protein